MPLRDAAGAAVATWLAEVLPDDEGCAPGIGKLLLVAVLLGLFVAAEGQLLGADVLGPVVGQFLERGCGLLKACLGLSVLLGEQRAQGPCARPCCASSAPHRPSCRRPRWQ